MKDLQPGHVGIEPATFWSVGRHPNNRATLARVYPSLKKGVICKVYVYIQKLLLLAFYANIDVY